jgi:hypothetical protein
MAKIYTYSMILAAIVGMMTLAGISNTGIFNILNLFGFSLTGASNFSNSYGWLLILGTIAGAATVGIISGVFGRSVSESYVLVPVIISLLAWFIVDWVAIVNYIWISYPDMSWLGSIMGLIFFVITVGFAMSIIQFWRGNDI